MGLDRSQSARARDAGALRQVSGAQMHGLPDGYFDTQTERMASEAANDVKARNEAIRRATELIARGS